MPDSCPIYIGSRVCRRSGAYNVHGTTRMCKHARSRSVIYHLQEGIEAIV